jgi:hypothetical protein
MLVLVSALLIFSSYVRAEDAAAPASSPEAPATSESAPPPQSSAPVPATKAKAAPKGKRYREKEAEGTEAPDRFEANTVIKSKYTLEGRTLEVDPD